MKTRRALTAASPKCYSAARCAADQNRYSDA